ncbi:MULTISPECIES: GGDEF domain-containing protein [unclassified Rhodococcus (in: high G+C Gram-positive bacteria)]|uniref:GGDEF domain-containing protein n=1 Tax=unclassified Rhodococcus (in: high G+C Gram-positive bacteria) TaxID=192944 RepID=UPI000AD6CFF2|nr:MULTISPECIES: GGDEF domain-containing protein [unclassified Rhodococcus (in: high G+C Gram-positive bacteria)]
MNSGWQYSPASVARTSGVNCLVSGLVGVVIVVAASPRAAAVLCALAVLWCALGVYMIAAAPVLSRRLYLLMHLSGLTSIALFCTAAGGEIAALSGIFLQLLLVTPAFIVLPARIAWRTTVLNASYIAYLGIAVGDLHPVLVVNAELVVVAIAISAAWVQSVASTSEIDDLTRLANRRRLTRELDARPGTVASGKIDAVAVVDIDHFKVINDDFGHAAGDHALVTVSDALRNFLPPQHLLSRSGGDEFTVLCITGTGAELRTAIDRVRTELPADLTISVGVACRQDGETARATLERADRALYESKKLGRNRTTIHD